MTINYRGYKLEVDYNFIKGEKQTYDYVGSADEVEIYSIELNDINIMELLGINQVYEIEDIILEELNG